MELFYYQYHGPMVWDFRPGSTPQGTDSTFYRRDLDRISFGFKRYHEKWVAAHEFAHALHHIAMGGITGTESCIGHSKYQPSGYQCAFSEGFADYSADAALGTTSVWETGGYTTSLPGRDRAEIEGNFAALLNDLIDGTSESEDDTDYSSYYVGSVFESCRADNVLRKNVTEFVWCLENRVNSTVHKKEFPHGPSAPNSVRESAHEPSDWDADDIRTVWVRNIGESG